jgi:hypothetical protein
MPRQQRRRYPMASRRATRLVRARTAWNRISAHHIDSNVRDQTVGADRDNRTLSTLSTNLRCGGSDSQAARALCLINIALRVTLRAGPRDWEISSRSRPRNSPLRTIWIGKGPCGRDGSRTAEHVESPHVILSRILMKSGPGNRAIRPTSLAFLQRIILVHSGGCVELTASDALRGVRRAEVLPYPHRSVQCSRLIGRGR